MLIGVTFVVRSPDFREGLRYTLQGAGLFVLFSFVLQEKGRISAVLLSKPAQVIGLYSYTLYLIHFAALLSARHLLPGTPDIFTALLAGLVSFAFAAGMHAFVEKPLGTIRQRLNRVEEPDPSLAQQQTFISDGKVHSKAETA